MNKNKSASDKTISFIVLMRLEYEAQHKEQKQQLSIHQSDSNINYKLVMS